MSGLQYAPTGNPLLDRFQQAAARAVADLEGRVALLEAERSQVFVKTIPVAAQATVLTFLGLNGNDPGTLGYLLRFSLRASAGSTRLGLRFNGDSGSNYRSAFHMVLNNGTTATGAGSDSQSSVFLTTNAIPDNGVAAGTVAVPVAAAGDNRYVQGSVGFDETSVGGRGSFVRGRWTNAASPITSIAIVAIAGSFDAGVATLFRTVR